VRTFKYVNTIKEALESECPMTVSCAGNVTFSARDPMSRYVCTTFFYFNENLIIINNTSINQGITSKNEQITFSWEDHEKMVERQ
jgi:hypothetical protein